MNPNDETYLVWIVMKNGMAWTGTKFSQGVYDAKLYGREIEAKNIAARWGATAQLFQIAAHK